MNTYYKYAPNVFLAKCEEKHSPGDVIVMTTRRGQDHDCIIHNLVFQKDGVFYYSITRADGFNHQEWAKRRADKAAKASLRASEKSTAAWKASNKDAEWLSLGEPIKIGHHSEKKHRRAIEQANRNMDKSVQYSRDADRLQDREVYWSARANEINLSMPESLEYYEHKLEMAIQLHQEYKTGKRQQEHSYSLAYARKAVKDLQDKVETAKKLWEVTPQ